MKPLTTTRRLALIAVSTLMMTATGCGGGDEVVEDASGSSDTAPAAADDEPSGESAEEPAADSGSGFGGGSATVTIEGVTYEFASDGGSMTVCKDIFGTFQVLLPYIDETGQPADGPELDMIALQPGIENDDARDAYVEVNLPTGDLWVAGESGLAEIIGVDTLPVTAAADGMTFSATVTLTKLYDAATTTDAVIDVMCS